MLARVVRSAVQQQQQRAISSTTSAAKSLQIHPVIAPAPPAVSSGELAWCEIYGLDYEQQIQEALDESPLLESDAQRAIPTLTRASASEPRAAATTATSSAASAKGDIWNVVFGASTA